jgi:hypothetical protein
MLFLGTILFALFVVGIPLLLTYFANARYHADKDWKLLREKFGRTNPPRENIHIIPKAKIGKKTVKYALKIGIDTDGVYFHVSKLFTSLTIWFVPWSCIDNLSINDNESISFTVENISFELYPINPTEFYEILHQTRQKYAL